MRWLLLTCSAFLLLAAESSTANRHQAGTGGSGLAQQDTLNLNSILVQTAIGHGGNLTSGFMSVLGIAFYLPGDADANGLVNISDAVFLVSYIFTGGSAPNPVIAGDANCDHMVNISDAIYLIAFIFGDGSPPRYCG
jgi:hypothetical protein